MTTDDDARATTEFRDIPEADCDRALDLTYSVFHLTPGDKTRRRHAGMLRPPPRRAYDGGQLAGVAGAHRRTLSVPGANYRAPQWTSSPYCPRTGAAASSPR